mgnify:CR=1 FL=1
MILNDGLDDCQPETIAFHFGVLSASDAIEPVKYEREVGRGDPKAGILYADFNLFLFHRNGKRDGPSLWRVFNGIADHVREHLP